MRKRCRQEIWDVNLDNDIDRAAAVALDLSFSSKLGNWDKKSDDPNFWHCYKLHKWREQSHHISLTAAEDPILHMGLLTAGELAVDFQPHFVQCASKLFGRLQKPLMSNRLSLIQGVEPSQETPDLIGNALLIYLKYLAMPSSKYLKYVAGLWSKLATRTSGTFRHLGWVPLRWVSWVKFGEVAWVALRWVVLSWVPLRWVKLC